MRKSERIRKRKIDRRKVGKRERDIDEKERYKKTRRIYII